MHTRTIVMVMALLWWARPALGDVVDGADVTPDVDTVTATDDVAGSGALDTTEGSAEVDTEALVESPVLLSIEPASCFNDEDTMVGLTGTGFGEITSVMLDDKVISLLSYTDTTISAIVPKLPAKVYDVTVTRADGAQATLSGAFEVLSPDEHAESKDFSSCSLSTTASGTALLPLIAAMLLVFVARRRGSRV